MVLEITPQEVRECLREQVTAMVNATKECLAEAPAELAHDVLERGIFLTGGSGLLRGLDMRLSGECEVPVHMTENPLQTVALGAGQAARLHARLPFGLRRLIQMGVARRTDEGAEEELMTFSIVACDLERGDWGIAVASKFPAVGSVVPWARAGRGRHRDARRTRTPTTGPMGSALLGQGVSADAAVARLTGADDGRAARQVGMVDASGGAASFTGDECMPWAGGMSGEGFACQGNILVGARGRGRDGPRLPGRGGRAGGPAAGRARGGRRRGR